MPDSVANRPVSAGSGGLCGPYSVAVDLDHEPKAWLGKPRAFEAASDLRITVCRSEVVDSPQVEYLSLSRNPQDRTPTVARLRAVSVTLDWASGTGQWCWPQSAASADYALISRSWLVTLQALALRHQGILLHGCAIDLAGVAAVVVGPSGAGKSTLAARFGGRAVHDDMCIVARDSGRWVVWHQDVYRPFGFDGPRQLPLGSVFALAADRSRTVATPLRPGEAAMKLLAQCHDAGGAATAVLADHVQQLLEQRGLMALSHCLTDDLSTVATVLENQGRAPDGDAPSRLALGGQP